MVMNLSGGGKWFNVTRTTSKEQERKAVEKAHTARWAEHGSLRASRALGDATGDDAPLSQQSVVSMSTAVVSLPCTEPCGVTRAAAGDRTRCWQKPEAKDSTRCGEMHKETSLPVAGLCSRTCSLYLARTPERSHLLTRRKSARRRKFG